jgi:hypothetical protein
MMAIASRTLEDGAAVDFFTQAKTVSLDDS